MAAKGVEQLKLRKDQRMDEISISKTITESFFKEFLNAPEMDVAIARAGKDDGDWNWDDELEEDETELEAGLQEELWEIQDFLDGRA